MLGWIQLCPIYPLVYHPYEYLGEVNVAYLNIICGGLYLFIMYLLYPIHWVDW